MSPAVEVCPICHQSNNDEDTSSIAEIRQVCGNEIMDANTEEQKRALLEILENLTCLQAKETRFDTSL